jgi:hypothetical protein
MVRKAGQVFEGNHNRDLLRNNSNLSTHDLSSTRDEVSSSIACVLVEAINESPTKKRKTDKNGYTLPGSALS